MRIRTRLLIMILAVLVPAFLAVALAVGYVYVEERRAQENSVTETVRAFSLLVDNELQTSEGILHALANSPALAEGDMDEFYRHAKAIAPLREGAIALYDPAGRRLLDTRIQPGSALPERRLANIDALARRYGADRTLVSDVFASPEGGHRFVVQVPVHIGGRIAYFLSMSSTAGGLQRLLTRQRFPEQWQAAITDRQGRIVARLQEADRFRGHLVRDEVLRSFAAVSEGAVSATNLAGIPMRGFFNTVPDAGWRVMVTIPQAELRRVPLHTSAFLGAIMTVLLVLAVAAARGGRPPPPPPPPVSPTAPRTPRGASRTISPMALNSTVESFSMKALTLRAVSPPTRARLTPNRIAKTRTCSTSLRAKASKIVSGRMLRMKAPKPLPWSLRAFSEAAAMALGSRLAGSMFMPWPGPAA
nr:cache domain-containing protein [uncultured Massilia sp.]